MSETYQFSLPLLQAVQAQKHVTVNEALCRLDAVAQLRVSEVGAVVPPSLPAESQAFVVGGGAAGDWSGKDAQIALWFNGDWEFIAPRIGWRAYDEATDTACVFDGQDWIAGAQAVSASGSATMIRILEVDHVLDAAATSETALTIPSHAMVLGVTARVLEEIPTTGGVSSWSLGINGALDRYGSGLGLQVGSYALGVASSPLTYWADTPVVITADAGSFAGGKLRLALHLQELKPPRQA